MRNDLEAAEQTGLNPDKFDPAVAAYLDTAQQASAVGYAATFLVTAAIAVVGLLVSAWLVRRPPVPDAVARPDETAGDSLA